MMKRLLLFFTLAAMLPLFAASPSPETATLAREYLLLSGTRETMERTIEAALAAQLRQTPELLPYRPIFLAYFRQCLSFESNEKELIALYAERFTATELRELIAFAKTPLGRKRARIEAEVGAELSAITSAKLLQFRPELQKALEAAVARQGTGIGAGKGSLLQNP